MYNAANPASIDTADAVRDQYLESMFENVRLVRAYANYRKTYGKRGILVQFSQEFTPTEIVESIQEWGHIIITPQEIDVKL